MSRISSIAQGPYGVETAIEQAGGHGPYQKKMLAILCGVFWVASSYVMGMGFYLAPPRLICSDGETCSQATACGHPYTKATDSVHGMSYEWNLVCDREYVATLIGVIFFIGTVTGSPAMSWLANTVGRKQCTVYALAITSVLLLAGGFAPSPEVIYGVSFVSGFTMAGFGVGTFLLLDEMVDTEYRNLYSGLLFSFWSVGTCSNAVLFYFLDNWRHVMLLYAVAAVLLIPLVCTLHESVRWVVVNQKNVPEANRILQQMAQYNGITDWKVEVHHVRFQGQQPQESSSEDADEKLLQQMDTEVHFRDLFTYHRTRTRVIACAILYFGNNLCYYGIIFALSTYIGNIYVNGGVLGLGEIIPSIVTGAILNHLPRKAGSLVSGFLGALTATGAYLCILWPCDRASGGCLIADTSTAFLLFLSMYVFASSFMMLAIFITELFPTRYRSLALGVCNTCAKVGGLLSSTLMVLRGFAGVHPLLIIAGSSFLGSLSVFLLPETKGKELEDY